MLEPTFQLANPQTQVLATQCKSMSMGFQNRIQHPHDPGTSRDAYSQCHPLLKSAIKSPRSEVDGVAQTSLWLTQGEALPSPCFHSGGPDWTSGPSITTAPDVDIRNGVPCPNPPQMCDVWMLADAAPPSSFRVSLRRREARTSFTPTRGDSMARDVN